MPTALRPVWLAPGSDSFENLRECQRRLVVIQVPSKIEGGFDSLGECFSLCLM